MHSTFQNGSVSDQFSEQWPNHSWQRLHPYWGGGGGRACLIGADGGEHITKVALGAGGHAVAGVLGAGLQVCAAVHGLEDAKVVLKVADERTAPVRVVCWLLYSMHMNVYVDTMKG